MRRAGQAEPVTLSIERRKGHAPRGTGPVAAERVPIVTLTGGVGSGRSSLSRKRLPFLRVTGVVSRLTGRISRWRALIMLEGGCFVPATDP